MSILSLDLAIRSYADNGLVVLRRVGDAAECEAYRLADALAGAPEPEALATYLAELAERVEARLVLIDGPQAWKAPENGLEHQRRCEKALHTPGKTGLPGVVKPRSWTRFAEFSIALFDALARRGWPRLARPSEVGAGRRRAVESFPTAAWRGIGLTPLPGKPKTSAEQLARQHDLLSERCGVSLATAPSHDELQALVAGLAGLAAEAGEHDHWMLAGSRPFEAEGHWREGFIACPVRPDAAGGSGG